MQLHLERPDHPYFMRGADGAHALVNGMTIRRSFILSPQSLVSDWDVRDVATLTVADLEPLLALDPELVLLGTGDVQAFPPAETLAACLGRGVGLEAMVNPAAARTFNVLAGEGRRVVAGFVLAHAGP